VTAAVVLQANNLSSTTPVLNGAESAPLRLGVDGSLPPLSPTHVSAPAPAAFSAADSSGGGGRSDGGITVPPRSWAFHVLLDADAPGCKGRA
jgi:hypothetical protein